jgi:hypothetical protein
MRVSAAHFLLKNICRNVLYSLWTQAETGVLSRLNSYYPCCPEPIQKSAKAEVKG